MNKLTNIHPQFLLRTTLLKLTHRNRSLRNIYRVVSPQNPQTAVGLRLNLKTRLESSLLKDLHALLSIRVSRQRLGDRAVRRSVGDADRTYGGGSAVRKRNQNPMLLRRS